MATSLEFDTATEPGRQPAGPPRVPISESNLTPEEIRRGQEIVRANAPPSVPISQGNFDFSNRRTLEFDPPSEPTEAQKSVARIRDIATKMKSGSPYTPGPLDYIADAATLSTARPISAAIGAATGGLLNSYPGSSFGERYKAGVDFMNDRAATAEKMTGSIAPVVGGLAQLPATMAMPGVRAATAPASTLKVMGQAAIPGAIEGASQNAGSVRGAVTGAATNAALSAGTAGVLDKTTKTFMPAARRGAAAEAVAARGDSPQALKDEAKTYFRQLDNNGIAYDPQQTAGLYTALHDLRNTSQYTPTANPTLEDHFNDLLRLTRQGATFNQLHDIRSAIADQARGPDASTRRAAGAMINEIDRLVNNTAPALNPNNINVKDAYGQARNLWRGAALADDASWHVDNVARKEAINSGIDPNKAMKAEFGAVEKRISRPGAYDPYTPDQRELLSRIVNGDPGQNRLGNAGSALSRNSNLAGIGAAGLASSLGLWKGFDLGHSVAGGLIGVPVTMAAKGIGGALENAAAARGQQNVNALLRSITGSPTPVPGAAITRGDLAKILFAQDLERMAPRVGSQVIGNQQEPQR
jgi:hypothetical protein